MNEKRPAAAPPPAAGISIGDIYYILFRQKWIILFFCISGILTTGILFLIKPQQYQSEAELSIQYVMVPKPLSAPGEEQTAEPLDGRDGIIDTEGKILHSLDLAQEVVRILTPQRILNPPGISDNTNLAALYVRGNLAVESSPASGVLRLTFQHPDPEIPQQALRAILDAYFIKHVQMHQGMQLAGSFLTNETNRVQNELAATEAALRKVKMDANVISSVDDTKKVYTTEISNLKQALFDARVELAGHVAAIREYTKDVGNGALAVTNKPTNAVATASEPVPQAQLENYKSTITRLEVAKRKEQEYLTEGFTDENVLLKETRDQIAGLTKQKIQLEAQYPKLTSVPVMTSANPDKTPSGPIDLQNEYLQVASLQSKIDTLNSNLSQVWNEATNFQNVEATITDLQQKKDLEESNLKYFETQLAQANFNTLQTDDQATGIKMIQQPSFPMKGWTKSFKKKAVMPAIIGVCTGFGLAFLLELILDRSVRRPSEIETKLRLPLLISIPDAKRNGHVQRPRIADRKRPLLSDGAGKGSAGVARRTIEEPVAPWDRIHALRPFYEGLRDRLIVHFESRKLPSKPKLVAVTSCNHGAGVSSTAAGLAATLSETAGGNVLLVDLTGEQGAAQQFHKGRAGGNLDDAWENGTLKNALVEGSFSVVPEPANGEQLPSELPKRLTGLMPNLKWNDYDYVVFDMPPVTQTSVTARLAGLMDIVLLVIESEKTNQDVVKRVNQLLVESNAKVSTVLNKARSYIPKKLHQEFLNDV